MPKRKETTPGDYSYFGMQSSWGVSKHFGGLRATAELAALCHIEAGKSVLVVGTGIGMTPCYLAKHFGCQVVGIDLSEKMVAWSRKRAMRKGVAERVELQIADAQQLPFEAGGFDAVLVESVNAFVADQPRAFAEYVRVIKPGGYVGLNEGTWVKMPPPAELLEFIARTMQARFYPPEGWKTLLGSAGLEITAARIYPIKMLRQRLDENAGMDLQDWADHLSAIGSFIRSYASDAVMRSYARGLVPSRTVVRDLFAYLGYGNYAGCKFSN
jgi:cyclopropane fatty-acyl-phospholipid synthase-like methyltransferase